MFVIFPIEYFPWEIQALYSLAIDTFNGCKREEIHFPSEKLSFWCKCKASLELLFDFSLPDGLES